jgi:hypothetical protein
MLRPPPQLTVSQWAEQHRMLGTRASSEPGPWRTARTPYLRDVMDALSAVHPARRVVFMKGAQVGAPLAINTAIPTAEGWATMDALIVGDTLFDETGTPCRVTDQVVFSRRPAVEFTPSGSTNTYLIAPLSFRERQAFRGEMLREIGIYPAPALMLAALRESIRGAAPANAADLLAAVDAAEADPNDAEAATKLAAIESAFTGAGPYGEMLATRYAFIGLLPLYALRHGLRDWHGEGLPEFTRTGGLVPLDLLDELPADDVEAAGNFALTLGQPGPSAEKNSVPPSPSPAIPTATAAA